MLKLGVNTMFVLGLPEDIQWVFEPREFDLRPLPPSPPPPLVRKRSHFPPFFYPSLMNYGLKKKVILVQNINYLFSKRFHDLKHTDHGAINNGFLLF